MGREGGLGLLVHDRRDEAAPALPLRASDLGDRVHLAPSGGAGEMLETGRALALTDLAPPSLGAGERLVRLAYRLGVPGSVLRSPFRKAANRRLLATVENPLPGQRAAGTALRAGWLTVHGGRLALHDLDYASKAITPPFELALHGFRWLDDLAAAAPRESGAPLAETLLGHWLGAHLRASKGPAWSVGNAGQRLLAWLIHAPLLLSGRDKAFRGKVLAAIEETARWLDRHVGKADDRLAQAAGWSAIVAAGLLLPEGKPRRLYGEAGLIRALGELVGDDGGVLSRSPLAQIEAIELLVRLRACYRAVRRDPPQALAAMLEMLVPPLLGVLHGDGGLGNWQGAGAIDAGRIAKLVRATGVRTRPLREARQWGYQRITAGPPRAATVLVVDAAPPPLARHARDGCASTLAFELSDGAHRLVVNCGGVGADTNALPPDLVQALRTTAAHSTLTLGDRNSTAVHDDGTLGKGVGQVELSRDETGGTTIVEASHDGYVRRFGFVHQRRLKLKSDGSELEGDDVLIPEGRRRRAGTGYAVRFHLHPAVEVTSTADGQGAILRIRGGSAWQFRCRGGQLAIEDSLWLDGSARPHASQQLVITGDTPAEGITISWALKRAG